MRSWIEKGIGLLFLTMFLGVSAAPAFGQAIVGMDSNGNFTCDGEMGIPNAVQGQSYSLDIYLDDNAATQLVILGLVFGVQDSASVSNVNFVWDATSFPAPWNAQPFREAIASELTPAFATYVAGGTAWLANVQNLGGGSTAPTLLGELTFTSEIDGCISFGIDKGDGVGAGSAFFTAGFSILPIDVCDPNICTSGDPLAIDNTDPTCPIGNAKNGDVYGGATFMATGGVPPYTWSQTGLPTGMDINGTTGVIEGTPNDTPGNFPFTVTVTDDEGNSKAQEQRSCSLTLDPADLAVDTNAPTCPLPNGKVGDFYDGPAFTATGGVPPYTWDISSNNAHPGLAMGGATGKITGTPTVFGSRTYTVRVTDDDQNTATRQCQLTIDPADLVIDANGDCPFDLTFNTEMNPSTFTATGGVPPYTWDALNLPASLTIASGTGQLSGFPTEGGVFNTKILVSDSGSPTDHDTLDCSITVTIPELVIDPQSPACPIPDADIDVVYNPDNDPDKAAGLAGVEFFVTGGVPPYEWSQVGLPNGMDIDQKNGIVSGTPTESGGFAFTVFVDDAEAGGAKTQASRTCSLYVNPADGGVTVSNALKVSGAPGATVKTSFFVESSSGAATTYDLTAFTSNGWDVAFSGDSTLSLGALAGDSVDILVTIPGDVSCTDGTDLATLIATRTDDSTITDQGTGQINVTFAKGVSVGVQLNGTCAFPGSVKTETFTVRNTGDCEQLFNLSSFNSAGWAQDAPKSVTIPGSDSSIVTVDVTVPANAECDETSMVHLTATCDTDQGVTGADSISIFVCDVFDIDVVGPANQNAAPGDTVEYCFTVANTGNCDDFFDVTLFAGAWDLVSDLADPLKFSVFEIPAFGDTLICVKHVVPEDAQEFDDDSFCLIAEHAQVSSKGIAFDSACVTTTVEEITPICREDISVEFIGYTSDPLKGGGVPVQSFDPGSTFGMLFSVTNNGPARAYDLSYNAALGWNVVPPASPTSEFTGKQQFELVVTVPEDAECEDIEEIIFAVSSRCTEYTVMDTAYAEVNATCTMEIEFLTSDQIGAPGDTLEYSFEVTNTGNCAGFFSGEVFSIWDNVTPGEVPVKLEAGQTAKYIIGHVVPKTAVSGDEDLLKICVFCDDEEDPPLAFDGGFGDPFFESCDSVTSRVSTDCAQGQPVLQLGGFQTLNYDGRFWEVQVAMTNNGPGTAKNINAMMDSDIEWLIITDADCAYGDLPEGATSYGIDSYTFDLLNYPGGSFNVWFDVTYTDTCESQQYTVRLDPEFMDPTADTETGSIPSRMVLHQNVPNPFNPLTKITFDLPEAGRAHLAIYNAAGQQIKTLANGHLPAGAHSFEWRGKDSRGKDMPSGTYFYSLSVEGRDETRRMVLIR